LALPQGDYRHLGRFVERSSCGATGVKGPLGLLGGTFDPPHVGHLALARAALAGLDLDRVVLVVANDPWQKSSHREVSPAAIRWGMVVASIEGEPGLVASDVEIGRGGPSFTIDTVAELAPDGAAVTLLLGADSAAGLDSWHRADELRRRVQVAVAARPGTTSPVPPGWNAVALPMAPVDVSSSEIRRRCAEGEPIDHLVAPGAAALIAEHGLYGFGR
jgi:nicotinate-nucleotide adenylyltransferase